MGARLDKRIERARARHDLARLVMGTILLVLYMYVCMYVCMNEVDIYLLCMIKVRVRCVLVVCGECYNLG